MAGFHGQVPIVQDGKLKRKPATPAEYLTRNILHNAVFGGEIKLEGIHVSDGPSMIIGEPTGQPSLVVSQPWYSAQNPLHPTPSLEVIETYLGAHGFLPVQGAFFGWVRPHDGVIIADARTDNFILTAQGPIAIDLQISQVDPEALRGFVVS